LCSILFLVYRIFVFLSSWTIISEKIGFNETNKGKNSFFRVALAFAKRKYVPSLFEEYEKTVGTVSLVSDLFSSPFSYSMESKT
jgi:hypothetical protein